MNKALVGIIMGSDSDMEVMKDASTFLHKMQIAYELEIVSAHRTPEKMFEYAKSALGKGLKVIIAGAGGAAHLPGMIASLTTLPVIGVPVKSNNSIDGWDSLLSIVQIPNGVPVATVAVNASMNAGVLATQIIATYDQEVADKLKNYKEELKEKVNQANKSIKPIV